MEMIPFEYESKQVRIVQDENGDPDWVAKDVYIILDSYVTQTRRLDDEKGLREIQTLSGPQNMVTINESGPYALIVRSNKPKAKNSVDESHKKSADVVLIDYLIVDALLIPIPF